MPLVADFAELTLPLMKRLLVLLSFVSLAALTPAANLPGGVDPSDPLLQLGCLDVTQAPYRADPSGRTDSTAAIQRALNVERVFANPQSEIKDCAHLRIFYFKVEAGTTGDSSVGDANTPGRITRSRDVRVYCMVGNVRRLGDHPMLEIADSDAIVVSQVKAFAPGTFPHLTETRAAERHSIPSSKAVALFVRD